jgi:hypothetical protein
MNIATITRRVLVIGGGGVSGRRILDDLRRHAPTLELVAAGRTRPRLPGGIGWRALDIAQIDAAALTGFDLVIIAAGPFDDLRERAHRACIAARVDVVDINDSYDAAIAIHALDADARAAGVRIVTGAGLSPGLSGLLLAGLRTAQPQAKRFDSTLYLGAKNAGGATAPLALFGGFRQHQPQWQNGALVDVPTPWRTLAEPFAFAHLDRPVGCVPQASPELAALARNGLGVTEIRHRFHVQGMPAAFARLCARLRLEARPRLAHWLAARLFAASGGVARKASSSPVVSACVTDVDSGAQWRVHGDVPAYHATAAVAAMFALALVDGRLSPAPGVHAPEWLAHDLDWPRELRERGIVVETGHRDDARGWLERVGASSEAHGTVRSLRHYGRCWYSVAIPPSVQRWQWRCLADSALYAALKRRHGAFARGVLVVRMALDWRRAAKRLPHMPLFGAHDGSTAAAAMRRDFSMFAAGYARLRTSLGADVAAELYPRMFLDTGAMEMHWLTPSASVFGALPDPAAAFADYVAAYFRAYAELGAIDLDVERDDGHLSLRIRRCAFAQIFNELGAAELAPLVRRMESEHFGGIAAALGVRFDYRDHPLGLARFELRTAADHPITETADERHYA